MIGCFQLRRLEDPTGCAGTGIVAEGFLASNGKVMMTWVVEDKPQSCVVYDCLEDIAIHLHGGKTIVEWLWTLSSAENCLTAGMRAIQP